MVCNYHLRVLGKTRDPTGRPAHPIFLPSPRALPSPHAGTMSGAIPSNGTELSGDAKLVVEEVIKAAEKEGDGNAAAASVVAIAAAEEEEEKEELPDTLVEEVFYVTSDSSAPTYMIRPWDKERTQLSKWLWLLFGGSNPARELINLV